MPLAENDKGIVYLVGAGPGDPDLITVKAQRLLRRCDAVVYDSLIPYELVLTLPAGVEHHYVGKEAGKHSLPQPEINDLLIKLARQGKRVVRFKGGDPFVFGRGGEEAEHLKTFGIRYEVVPGVTSGVAALAYAGIPCTDRRVSSYVVFLTGHKALDETSPVVPWEWLAGARGGTLVIYMGVAEAKNIVDRLIASGMPPDTPAGFVERGTFSTQRAASTTLADLPGKMAELAVKPPALLVLGEVANYRENIEWFQKKPLYGLRVMVTRPADQAAALYSELRDLGVEVLAYPTIATTSDFRADEWEAVREVTSKKRWLLFTSENGVRYFFEQWFSVLGDIRGLMGHPIAAVGNGAVRALAANHITPELIQDRMDARAVARKMSEISSLSNATVVRVRGNLGGDRLENTLEEAGAEVIPLHVHRTFYTEWLPEAKKKLFAHPPDVIMFTSGAAVRGLAENLDEQEMKKLASGAAVVSVGPATSRVIGSYGIEVEFESKKRTLKTLVEELLTRYRKS